MNTTDPHWTYQVRLGKMYEPDGELLATGYSGMAGAAKNNPMMERVHGQGPIPRGWYTIGGVIAPPSHTGPWAMRLTPVLSTETFGRGDFEIHGDSISHPGEASHGCIILFRPARQAIAASPVRLLEVTT